MRYMTRAESMLEVIGIVGDDDDISGSDGSGDVVPVIIMIGVT